MENFNFNCSSKDHENIEAFSFCQKCEIYMCNKCENIHSKLCQNHQTFKLNKDWDNIFTGYCKEKNHNEKLEFYCKTHNKLCCGSCLCKIKEKDKGQHNDCDVCIIESIKDEKKSKLLENIKTLENFSKNLKDSIDELKKIFTEINENKEKLKLEIQNTFTKLRNIINEREDQILVEIDNLFEKKFFSDNLVKESEKLPNKINFALECGKKMSNKWENENLNLLINKCINIENNIQIIETIREKIDDSNMLKYVQIKFVKNNEKEIHEELKKFGSFDIFNNLLLIKGSLIIKNNINYLETLYKWINPKSNIEAKLLYRKSRDGDSYNIFHQLCDKKGKTLILIKAENFIIGAYTPINWDSFGGWKNDDETFIFSLTGNKIYRKNKKSIESIYCGQDTGPWFGGIGTRDIDMSKGEFQFSREGYEFFGNIDDIIPNEGKNKFFDIDELEVYNIININF